MKRLPIAALIVALTLMGVARPAKAGNTVGAVLAGVAVGIGAALVLDALTPPPVVAAPVVVPPPPVVLPAPPPVVYRPAPVVVHTPPPVIVTPAPVVYHVPPRIVRPTPVVVHRPHHVIHRAHGSHCHGHFHGKWRPVHARY
jgi:hypothetical protein